MNVNKLITKEELLNPVWRKREKFLLTLLILSSIDILRIIQTLYQIG
ncbi:TPA: hypothetical protein ACGO1A_001370 [Streptococcus suis]